MPQYKKDLVRKRPEEGYEDGERLIKPFELSETQICFAESKVLTKYIPSDYSPSCGVWEGSWRKEQGRNHCFMLAKHENLVPSSWSCFKKYSRRFLWCGKWLLWSHLWRFLQEPTSNKNLYLFFCYFEIPVLQLAFS